MGKASRLQAKKQSRRRRRHVQAVAPRGHRPRLPRPLPRHPYEPHFLLGHYCVNTVETEHGATKLTAEFFPSLPWRWRRSAEHLRRRLSLDFLRRRRRSDAFTEHVLTDSRGGLLAFVRDNKYAVVCDPWNRQYRELDFPWLHPTPDEGSSERYFMEHDEQYISLGAFFLEAGAGGGGGPPMAGFRLLCAWLVRNYVDDTVSAHACVYSASERRWLRPCCGRYVSHGYCTTGHWIWNDSRFLGRGTGKFSTFRLPAVAAALPGDSRAVSPRYESRDIRVVGDGGAAGGVRIVSVVDGDQLEVLTWAHGARRCAVESRVGLCQLANVEASQDLSWLFLDNATTSADLVLGAFDSASSTMKVLSLDVETLKLQRTTKSMALSAERVFPYELE
ncbi:hypothetical protein HU200_039920 [Digitaria exilis]|uniref:Uncharacterized protein n=1 Tax=Digitaria exilis TaxID=1010633 RepID=A0A835B8W3_9POAL|nr:hypothetical protein HU200_039920 [Digitaria exilis]